MTAIQRAHGVPSQLNTYCLDVDSDCTGFGRHNRLIPYLGRDGVVTISETVRGLPMSTEADRMKVSRSWRRIHPPGSRLQHLESEAWGGCIDHKYRAVRKGRKTC